MLHLMQKWRPMLFNDARLYQILFLSLFLILGFATRDWTLQPGMIAVAIVTCLATQWVMSILRPPFQHQGSDLNPADADPAEETAQQTLSPSLFSTFTSSLPSALITSLGLSLLLRTDHYSTMVLAAVLAISSKFLIQIRGKHLFNPANIGIVAVLTLSHDAWVSPGQWGEEGWYALMFLATGGIVLRQVGRWDTTIVFLGTYAGLEAVRNVWLGWTWDVWGHRLINGSLLLFALFMITDPRTIPNARIGRVIWAIAIALLTFILRNVFFIPTAVFWALFALAPLSVLLDSLFPADRFAWLKPPAPADPAVPLPSTSLG